MARISLSLLLLLVATSCADPYVQAPFTPLPDDDDDQTDDDDDLEPAVASQATFAISMTGEVDDHLAPAYISTKLQGTLQVLYWTDGPGESPLCRQRIPFEAIATFGPTAYDGSLDCDGLLLINEPDLPLGPDEVDDNCSPAALGGNDLGFLALDEGRDADFRRMALLSLDELDWQLGREGFSVSELVETYKAAGLDATHVAMVAPGGWLTEEAELGEIAASWGEEGWLPMFVVYRDADRPSDAEYLPGEVFLSSLWRIGLHPLEEVGAPLWPGSSLD